MVGWTNEEVEMAPITTRLGRARWLVLGIAMVTLLAACGNDDDSKEPSGAGTILNVLAGVADQRDPNIAVLAYLPESVSMAPGTTVEWRIPGPEPHSVTFLPPGQTLDSIPKAQLREPAPPAGPFDGKSFVSSGLLPQGAVTAPPFRLTFPSVGEFTYVCVIHPAMTGKVVVVEGKAGRVDTQTNLDTRADVELNTYLTEGRDAKKKLEETPPATTENPDGTTTWRYGMGASTPHTEVLAFAPAQGEIRPKDQVTFVNETSAPHTATFAAGGQVPVDPTSPATITPTAPSPLTVTPTGGPFNSGELPPNVPPGTVPEAARSFTFVIPTAGEYAYVCILHAPSGMGGTIKVA